LYALPIIRKSDSLSSYNSVYSKWQTNPEGFWKDAAADIDWIKPPETCFDPTAGVYGRWFPDASCNTCYNCIDRHIEAGRGEQTAIIYDSPVTDTKKRYSYYQLFDEVTALATALENLGIEQGDRVIIYMPMIPQAAFAMLACARIGAIHSVVFGGFAPKELATRIDDAKPKIILSASCGIEPTRTIPYKPLLDEAIDIAEHKPESCMIYQRPELEATLDKDRDINWHSIIIKTKAAGPVIEEHNVSTLFTAPTALRAIKKEDAPGKFLKIYDISSLKTLFLAGERADPDTIAWSENHLGVPVIDNWWQTETGWPIASNPMGLQQLPIKYGSACVAMPGYDVQVLDESGTQLSAGELGAICIKLPLPPACLPTLWHKDDRFKQSYLSSFKGYYETAIDRRNGRDSIRASRRSRMCCFRYK